MNAFYLRCWCLVNLILLAPPLLAQDITISLKLKGQVIEGTPILADAESVCLLGRDGAIWEFSPNEAQDYAKVSDQFESYSAGQMRAALQAEFGRDFDVSGTGTYLVVHPTGQRAIWAQRFEDMYRSMVHYFTARRIPMDRPKFPLIAVVLPTQQEFLRYATQLGARGLDSATQGLYHLQSNRVLVYDNGDNSGADGWERSFSTVIHETAHQTAFNTGIHTRLGQTPAWLAEGIGTLFEAPGVYDPRGYRQLEDRINEYRFDTFLELLPNRPDDTLTYLISSDKLFNIDWRVAYANAWALTFYLTEREPANYAEYLRLTASRSQSADYPPNERLADFKRVFGNDLQLFDVRFVRYIESLRKN